MNEGSESSRIPPARRLAAGLVGVVSGVVAVAVGIGLLLGGCGDGCSNAAIAAQVALAATGVMVAGVLGFLGVRATLRGWRWLGLWVVAVLVLARLTEFVLTRL